MALLECLQAVRAQDPSVKSVVFSQFTTMLNLLQEPLTRAGFSFVRLDGRCAPHPRTPTIMAYLIAAARFSDGCLGSQ